MLQVLKKVMQHEIAESFFNEPVDPDALGIPEYRDFVQVNPAPTHGSKWHHGALCIPVGSVQCIGVCKLVCLHLQGLMRSNALIAGPLRGIAL